MKRKTAVVDVPATTANLGTGFDALGIALGLHNRCTVSRIAGARRDWGKVSPAGKKMMNDAADAFFRAARKKRFGFAARIRGDVPPASGLGSSVTVRLGVTAALNRLAGSPLDQNEILNLVSDLEGHPDNAAPAVLGGFVSSIRTGDRVQCVRAPLSKRLRFILAIPGYGMQTEKARKVLPKSYSRADAVHNLSRACLLTASFLRGEDAALWEAADDRLHQPYRAKLFRPLYPVLRAARKAGARGGWLSGSGTTICLLAAGNANKIIRTIQRTVRETRKWTFKVVGADNRGCRVR